MSVLLAFIVNTTCNREGGTVSVVLAYGDVCEELSSGRQVRIWRSEVTLIGAVSFLLPLAPGAQTQIFRLDSGCLTCEATFLSAPLFFLWVLFQNGSLFILCVQVSLLHGCLWVTRWYIPPEAR